MAQQIEFHRRTLAMFYIVFTFVFLALGLLFLMVALGNAVEKEPWSEKWVSVVGWAVAGLSWLLGMPQMWQMGRAYRKNFVRISDTDVTIHTVTGKEYDILFSEIKSITWDPSVRKRLFTITTADATYSFDTRSCPHVGKVAKLLQERTGVGS